MCLVGLTFGVFQGQGGCVPANRTKFSGFHSGAVKKFCFSAPEGSQTQNSQRGMEASNSTDLTVPSNVT